MKSIKIILSLIILVYSLNHNLSAQGNVGIGTTTPNPKAILDISSFDKGLLLPRMDSISRNQIDSIKGLLVYDTTKNSIWYNDYKRWLKLASTKTIVTSLPDSDSCGILSTFPGIQRQGAISFVIGNKAYIGTGTDFAANPYLSDIWEYTTSLGWIQKSNFGGGGIRNAVAFSIGTKGYIVTGRKSSGLTDELWEYNPDTDSWTQKASFPGVERIQAVGFSIGNKGYVGTGGNLTVSLTYKDLWEYDPNSDTWIQKADLPGQSRNAASCFVINNMAYVGIGVKNGILQKDFWRFNPSANSWSQIQDFQGPLRYGAFSFAIENFGFIGGGVSYQDDLYQYSAEDDEWIVKYDSYSSIYFGYNFGIGFGMNSKGFFGIGATPSWPLQPDLVRFSLGPIQQAEFKSVVANYFFGNQLCYRNGNVGIGTLNPPDKFAVYNGTTLGRYTIGGWIHSSDSRLKSNIRPLENSLGKILQLQGVQFNWKSYPDTKTQIGFIAQDVEKIFPEIVTKDQDGYYSLAYQNLTAPLVEAIKEQQAMIEELRTQNQSLEARLKAVEQYMAKSQ